MKVKSENKVAQSCPTPSNPMDCSLPGSSVHGIFQAKVLEWGAIAFSVMRGIYMLNSPKAEGRERSAVVAAGFPQPATVWYMPQSKSSKCSDLTLSMAQHSSGSGAGQPGGRAPRGDAEAT